MHYKLKYSSLLNLKKKNFILYLTGPLGKNILKIPSSISCLLDNKKKIIIFYSKTFRNKKHIHLSGFLSIFSNNCRIIVFGDLISLNLNGLGLKFLKISSILNTSKYYLSMNLGYSDIVNYCINFNHSIFFLKDSRNILCYSINFSYMRNQIFMLLGLKKPNRYKKKGFTIVDIIL